MVDNAEKKTLEYKCSVAYKLMQTELQFYIAYDDDNHHVRKYLNYTLTLTVPHFKNLAASSNIL